MAESGEAFKPWSKVFWLVKLFGFHVALLLSLYITAYLLQSYGSILGILVVCVGMTMFFSVVVAAWTFVEYLIAASAKCPKCGGIFSAYWHFSSCGHCGWRPGE
jgi:ribosomal protein S27AE